MVGNKEVVVTEYKEKFLVMPCKIKNDNLYIKKGEYYFMEINKQPLQYRSFENVYCQ